MEALKEMAVQLLADKDKQKISFLEREGSLFVFERWIVAKTTPNQVLKISQSVSYKNE